MTLAITSAIPVQQAVYTHPITPFPTVTITDPNQTVTLTITETTHKPGIDFSGHIGGDLLAGLITLTDPNAATDGSITNTFDFTLSGTPATITQALDQLQFDPSGFLTDPPSDSRLTLTVTDPTGATATTGTDLINNLTTPTQNLYRFFDPATGDHFLTASATEAAALPTLVPETNTFGHALYGDPAALPVARFFDTTNGSHFFTANAAEAASLATTRPDLILESAHAFYQHVTAQPGDTPVLRFFDTTTGTHIFTADATEALALGANHHTQAEGIAFYAPPNPTI